MISSLVHITRLARAGYVFAREGVLGLADPSALPPAAQFGLRMVRLIERPASAHAQDKLSKALTSNEAQIVAELKTVQGKPVDIGGYYKADSDKCKAVMRPSPTLNAALKTARV